MPVILTDADDFDIWLNAPPDEVRALQGRLKGGFSDRLRGRGAPVSLLRRA
jgi:hypothetical protein